MIGALALCLVVGVSDGDTIKVRCGEPGNYEQVTVRLGGIDAPEKKQAFGQRSKEAMSDLCFQQIATIRPRATDRYGRTVADVGCRNFDAGDVMVKKGMAWVFDKYAKGYSHLYPLQAAAKAARVGLWSDAEPMAPWDWRKAQKALADL